MIIPINLDKLLELDMSFGQYAFVLLTFESKYNTADGLRKNGLVSEEELVELYEGGVIINSPTVWSSSKFCHLSHTHISLILSSVEGVVERFWELCGNYPMKVGMRPLRPVSVDAPEIMECKEMYEEYLGEHGASKHAFVMLCLEGELELRRRTNAMEYMLEFHTWIEKQYWLRYEYLVDEKNTSKVPKYGEGLI
jgi:hypothetical protein